MTCRRLLTKPKFMASSAVHVIASTLFLDSPLAVWTRLCSALNFLNALCDVGIMIAGLIKLPTSHTLMPLDLVFGADLKSTVLANNLRLFVSKKLATTTPWSWTPDPILSRLLFNL